MKGLLTTCLSLNPTIGHAKRSTFLVTEEREYEVEPGYWAVEEETGEEGFESLSAAWPVFVDEHKDKVLDHRFIQRPNEVCTGIIVRYNEDRFRPIRPLLIHEAFSRRSPSKGCRKLWLHVAIFVAFFTQGLSGPFFKGALGGYLVVPHDFLNF